MPKRRSFSERTSTTLQATLTLVSRSLVVFKLKLQNQGSGAFDAIIEASKRRMGIW